MTTNLEVPTQTLALTAGWLDTGGKTNTTNTAQFSNDYGATTLGYTWPNTTYWYTYPVREHRPIKLGLSEVEKLRAAAKRDAKLKKILEKFTDQIEVVVDFK